MFLKFCYIFSDQFLSSQSDNANISRSVTRPATGAGQCDRFSSLMCDEEGWTVQSVVDRQAIAAPRAWNNLPLHIRHIFSEDVFSKELESFTCFCTFLCVSCFHFPVQCPCYVCLVYSASIL